MPRRLAPVLACVSIASCLAAAANPQSASTGNGWPTYGGDPGGQRYSNASQITRANVAQLQPVWTYHTHALESGSLSVSRSEFEDTPVLFKDALYIATPYDRVIALNPETGAELWSYDPKLAPDVRGGNYTSRGVAVWQGPGKGLCSSRILLATLDARLIALDAATGKPCDNFGNHGSVDLTHGVPTLPQTPNRYFGNTSPATVVGDVVVVGSSVADNQDVEVEPGYVRGFDIRTGQLLWTWDPIPWAANQHPRTGAANAWGVIAADPANHLVFIPTGAPSIDFYGGLRPGDNRDANSIVALDSRTGKKVWAFQLVHHDIWDYDVASEPLLFDFHGNIPAVAIAAKPGILFVFNRLTGEPLYPIQERPVPASDIPGEYASPTQPFSSLPPLTPASIDIHQLSGHDAKGLKACSDKLASLRYDGIYTPVSRKGSLQFPGSLGGVNWGSMSLDPETATLYVNTNRSAYEIRLVPQPSNLYALILNHHIWESLALVALLAGAGIRRKLYPGLPAIVVAVALLVAAFWINPPRRFPTHATPAPHVVSLPRGVDGVGELSPNHGAPFKIYRHVLQDDLGRPCSPTPWGVTSALNLNTGKMEWEKPLGTLIPGQHTGTVNFGAPIVTAGGLLFTAASAEPLLRAIDKATGEEVWDGKLPVPAQSTPMTYTIHGRQFVVVAAGGHGVLGTPLGDAVVAFALPGLPEKPAATVVVSSHIRE